MINREQDLYSYNRRLLKEITQQGQIIADKTREIEALKIENQILKETLQEERNIRKVLYQPKEQNGKTKRKRNRHD